MSHYSKATKRVSIPHVCSVKLFHAALVFLLEIFNQKKPHFDTMSSRGLNRSSPLTVLISSSQFFYWHIYMLHGLRNVHPIGGYVSYSGTGSGRVCTPWISRSRLSMDSVRSWFGISWLASSAVLQNPSAWHTNRKRKWTQQLQMLDTGRWGWGREQSWLI